MIKKKYTNKAEKSIKFRQKAYVFNFFQKFVMKGIFEIHSTLATTLDSRIWLYHYEDI